PVVERGEVERPAQARRAAQLDLDGVRQERPALDRLEIEAVPAVEAFALDRGAERAAVPAFEPEGEPARAEAALARPPRPAARRIAPPGRQQVAGETVLLGAAPELVDPGSDLFGRHTEPSDVSDADHAGRSRLSAGCRSASVKRPTRQGLGRPPAGTPP